MDVKYILVVISVNQPVLHYESERGYANHLETVSCEFLDLDENGDVHTRLFEAYLPEPDYGVQVG